MLSFYWTYRSSFIFSNLQVYCCAKELVVHHWFNHPLSLLFKASSLLKMVSNCCGVPNIPSSIKQSICRNSSELNDGKMVWIVKVPWHFPLWQEIIFISVSLGLRLILPWDLEKWNALNFPVRCRCRLQLQVWGSVRILHLKLLLTVSS